MRSTSMRVQRRPILSEARPAQIRPEALPIAMRATAAKATEPMDFFAMPLTLLMTMRPAPEPMKQIIQSSQNGGARMISAGFLLEVFGLVAEAPGGAPAT